MMMGFSLLSYHAKIGTQALLHFGLIASQRSSLDAFVGGYNFAGEESFEGAAGAAANDRSARRTNVGQQR